MYNYYVYSFPLSNNTITASVQNAASLLIIKWKSKEKVDQLHSGIFKREHRECRPWQAQQICWHTLSRSEDRLDVQSPLQ